MNSKFRTIRCPIGHKIIVADDFPFEYNSIKCFKCMKEYKIDSKGNVELEYKNRKPISRPISTTEIEKI